MRKLSCREAGEDCNFEAVGDTDDEVMRKAREHALSAHNRQLSSEEEQKARSGIRSM
jgi:predicted small metal-binding protein